MDISFRDIAGKLASFSLGAEVTSTVSVAAWVAAAVTVICEDADAGGAGEGAGEDGEAAGAPVAAPLACS
jgi:hypothetical protein